ncbi:MAG: hypothetical protein AAGA72_05235 [Pseudomonadota bacterium]
MFLLVLGGASLAHAEDAPTGGTTSADVLTWAIESQDAYFQTSIGMAGVVASQNEGPTARCVDDWYFKDRATRQRRNDFIRETMRRFPDYHPAGVILAVLEKQCGSFTFDGAP